MKTIHLFKVCRLIQAAALSAGLGLGFPASADNIYHPYIVDLNSKNVTDLGSLGGGSTQATAINDAGQVVGYSETPDGSTHAFITGPNGIGMTDLGSGFATGINDAGQVVGVGINGGSAFITGPNGVGMTPLAIPGGSAGGINNVGQVIGINGLRSFITGPNGQGITELGTLSGGETFANGINDAGQVVGSSITPYVKTTPDMELPHKLHAFITGPNGVGMTDLGAVPLNSGFYGSQATAINNTGQVVGFSEITLDGNILHAFITGPNGMSMTDLGTLGGHSSIALGINDSGQVVGGSEGHAFVTDPNGAGMTDLNSLVSLPGGIVLYEATAINNMGQVVAIAIIPGVPMPAIPEPASYALMIVGLGLVGFVARRRKAGGQSAGRRLI